MKLRLPNKMQAALVAAITAVSLTTLSSGAYGAELDQDKLLCTIAPNNNVASITPKGGEAYTSAGAAFGGYGVSDSAFTTTGGTYLGLDSWDTDAGQDIKDKFGNPDNSSLTMVFDASISSYDIATNNALVYYGRNDTNSGYALSIVNGNWTIQWGGKGGLSTSGLTTAYSSTANTNDTDNHKYILTFNNNVITAYQDDVMIAQSTGGNTVTSGGLDWTLGALTVNNRVANTHGYTSTISGIQLYSGVVTPTAAQDYVWTGSQSGTWDTATANWKTKTSETPVTFKPGTDNTVTFNADAQQREVTLATTVLVKDMTVTGVEYTLDLGGNTLTTGTLTISDGATLTVGGTGSMTLNSLTGTGTLVKNDGSTVTIKQAATNYTGAITVNAGTLVADAANAFAGSTNVSVGEGGTLVLKSADVDSVPSISGAGTVQIDVGNTTKYEYYNKEFLENFTGTVDIVSGKVQLGNQTNKFAQAKLKLTGGSLEGWGNTFTHAIELAGGTLADAGGDETYSGAISVTANSTVNASSGKTVTLSGALTGTGEITKAGAGTLKLAGTSTEFTGGLYADAGTVNITTATTLGSLRLGSGTLNIKADTTVNGQLRIGPENNHYAGTLVVDAGKTLSVASIATPWGFNSITVNGTLTVRDGGEYAITSNQSDKVIGGTGTINTPKLVVGNNSTKAIFAGGLTLNIGNGGIDGSSGVRPVEFRDVTVGVLGDSTGWSAANAITLAAGEGMATTFDVGTDKTVTLNGVVSGSGALAKTGDGTLRLTATNTFTGNITVSAGTLDIAGSIDPAVSIVVAADATLTGSGADAKKVGIAAGATATFTGAITGDGDGVSFTREGGVQVTNTKAEGDPVQYALNKSDLRVTAAQLTANSTEQVEVANQLAVTKVENTGTGTLSLTTGRDLSAIKEVFATSGDIHFLNVGNDAQALLSTLSLADGKTVSFNTGAVAGETDEATVTVAGMLVAGGPDSKLNANLVMDGSAVSKETPASAVLDVHAMRGIGGLNMGSSVTLNPGNVALSSEDMELISGLEFGGMYDLFNGVDSFIVGSNTYGQIGMSDAWVNAKDVFTDLVLPSDKDYYLFYSGANQGGVGGNVGTIYIMQMPEPTTGTLSLLALCALAARRRRK